MPSPRSTSPPGRGAVVVGGEVVVGATVVVDAVEVLVVASGSVSTDPAVVTGATPEVTGGWVGAIVGVLVAESVLPAQAPTAIVMPRSNGNSFLPRGRRRTKERTQTTVRR